MISAYLRADSSAMCSRLGAWPLPRNTPCGCECSTNGTARRPLIHSVSKGDNMSAGHPVAQVRGGVFDPLVVPDMPRGEGGVCLPTR